MGRNRTGLSLTEVLIATFVMAIGLLSLASLIPVGMHEVAVANRAQHAAIVGRSAWRDLKTREWLRPQAPSGFLWCDRTGNGPNAMGLVYTAPGVVPGAFAIDPLFLSVSSGDANSNGFPYPTDATALRLPRITMRLSEYDTNPILAGSYPLAEQFFVSRNEPEFNLTYLPTNAKTDRPHRVFDTATNTIPQLGGEYSWMMTVTPAQGEVGRLYTVSVVVFYKRLLNFQPLASLPAEQQKRECTANVTFLGAGIGGGDIQVNWTPSADGMNCPRLKPNQWLMLYRTHPVTNATEAVWYRIVASDDYDPGISPGQRCLTIQGPDWTVGGNTYAALFDSVVGVYTKTVQLE